MASTPVVRITDVVEVPTRGKSVTTYMVEVDAGSVVYQSQLRFSVLKKFHTELVKRMPPEESRKLPKFPGIRVFGAKDPAFLAKRRTDLETYLQQIFLHSYIQQRSYLLRPLGLDDPMVRAHFSPSNQRPHSIHGNADDKAATLVRPSSPPSRHPLSRTHRPRSVDGGKPRMGERCISIPTLNREGLGESLVTIKTGATKAKSIQESTHTHGTSMSWKLPSELTRDKWTTSEDNWNNASSTNSSATNVSTDPNAFSPAPSPPRKHSSQESTPSWRSSTTGGSHARFAPRRSVAAPAMGSRRTLKLSNANSIMNTTPYNAVPLLDLLRTPQVENSQSGDGSDLRLRNMIKMSSSPLLVSEPKDEGSPSIRGYTNIAMLFQIGACRYYSGEAQSNHQEVVIEVLLDRSASRESDGMFLNEFQIMKELPIKGVPNPLEILLDKDTRAIIFDAEAGTPMADLLPYSTKDFLWVGIKLCRIVALIHEAGIVHGSLSPQHITFNTNSKSVTLWGFQRAKYLSDLKKENVDQNDKRTSLSLISRRRDSVGVVDWAYCAPERTGCVTHFEVDTRSDLYALGITFFELLTGRLPFDAVSSSEFVRCHVAKKPYEAKAINPQVPSVLSDIIMRLLQKSPNDRYQTCSGLLADLTACFQMYPNIEPFELCLHDSSGSVHVPQSLFERDDEVSYIVDVFSRVCGGTREAVMVMGEKGMGKSALLKALIPRMKQALASCFILCSKYDVEVGGFVFRGFEQQIFSMGKEEVFYWKKQLKQAVGEHGALVVDLLPELSQVIGPSPPVERDYLSNNSPDNMSESRRLLTFARVISTLAGEGHPVIIMLDDIHLADAGQYGLLTGIAPPQSDVLTSWEDCNASLCYRSLRPLTTEAVRVLLASSLSCSKNDAEQLAELVVEKTAGNPFFVLQFLDALLRDQLISFHISERKWTWNINEIRQMNYTDNVSDLIISALQTLSPSAQRLLQKAVCLGRSFSSRVIQLLQVQSSTTPSPSPSPSTSTSTTPSSSPTTERKDGGIDGGAEESCDQPRTAAPRTKGLTAAISTLREHEKDDDKSAASPPSSFVNSLRELVSTGVLTESVDGSMYSFSNDQIYEAAYDLIDSAQRKQLHVQIGSLLLRELYVQRRREVEKRFKPQKMKRDFTLKKATPRLTEEEGERNTEKEEEMKDVTDDKYSIVPSDGQWKSLSKEYLDSCYLTLSQLNEGLEIISDMKDALSIVQLNMMAGGLSGSAENQLKYYRNAAMLVDRHASHASMQQYLYEVHFKIAIAERSLQRYDRVDAQIKEMEKYGKSEEQKGRLCCLQINVLFAKVQFEEAIALGKKKLMELGRSVELNEKERTQQWKKLEIELQKNSLETLALYPVVCIIFTRKKHTVLTHFRSFKLIFLVWVNVPIFHPYFSLLIDTLRFHQQLTDQRLLTVQAISIQLLLGAYLTDAHLFETVMSQILLIGLKEGTSEYFTTALGHYAQVLAHKLQVVKAKQYADIAFHLCQKKFPSTMGTLCLVYGSSIAPLCNKYCENDAFLLRAFHNSLDEGLLNFASLSIVMLTINYLLSGLSVEAAIEKIQVGLSFQQRFRSRQAVITQRILRIYLRLRGSPSSSLGASASLPSSVIDSELSSSSSSSSSSSVLPIVHMNAPRNEHRGIMMKTIYPTITNLYAMIDEFLSGDLRKAVELALNVKEGRHYLRDNHEPLFYLFSSLVFARAPLAELESYGLSMEEVRKDLAEAISGFESREKIHLLNYRFALNLLLAERLRLCGELRSAAHAYEKSIRWARKAGLVHFEGICNETYARACFLHGRHSAGKTYLSRARQCYSVWGAERKVQAMNEEFASYMNPTGKIVRNKLSPNLSPNLNDVVLPTGGDAIVDIGDDEAFIKKCSSLISEAIGLSTLVKSSLKTIFEYEGALSGCLVFERAGKLRIEAYGTCEFIQLCNEELLNNDRQDVSSGIVNYVIRTGSVVKLSEASSEGRFVNDSYVQSKSPKSILCIPVIVKRDAVAVLYMENNLTPGVFGRTNISLVSMMLTQLVLGMENARLNSLVSELSLEVNQSEKIVRTGYLSKLHTSFLLPDKYDHVFVVLQKNQLLYSPSQAQSSSITLKLSDVVSVAREADPPSSPSNGAHSPHADPRKLSFELTCMNVEGKKTAHVFSASSEKELNAWMSDIADCVKECLQLRDARSMGRQDFVVTPGILPSDIEINPKDVTLQETLGCGATAIVHKAMWKGVLVAVKIFQRGLDEIEMREFFEEITLMRSLRHPNILLLLGAYTTDSGPCLVTEFMSRYFHYPSAASSFLMQWLNGSLYDVLRDPKFKLTMERIIGWALCIARGMMYLHSFEPPILHRDLKPMNILMGSELNSVKIADFGMARVKDTRLLTAAQGTVSWMAPEMATREEPYRHIQFAAEIGNAVCDGLRPAIPSSCPRFWATMIQECWHSNPDERPTFAEIVPLLERQLEKHRLDTVVTPSSSVPGGTPTASMTSSSQLSSQHNSASIFLPPSDDRTSSSSSVTCNSPDIDGRDAPATTWNGGVYRPAATSHSRAATPFNDGVGDGGGGGSGVAKVEGGDGSVQPRQQEGVYRPNKPSSVSIAAATPGVYRPQPQQMGEMKGIYRPSSSPSATTTVTTTQFSACSPSLITTTEPTTAAAPSTPTATPPSTSSAATAPSSSPLSSSSTPLRDNAPKDRSIDGEEESGA